MTGVTGRLLSLGDVAALLVETSPTGTISRQTADAITRRKGFPDPVTRTAAGRLWDEEQVRAWIAEHRRPPEAPPDTGPLR
ncbi:hypothetical protein AB1484_29305 [Parafrankia sp. FMc6]|uniref:helix-turn-helix transcriptional regulator n=1 Tax=Parafrankia soli TaxID=2599596 RepID=UPI0034D7A6C7